MMLSCDLLFYTLCCYTCSLWCCRAIKAYSKTGFSHGNNLHIKLLIQHLANTNSYENLQGNRYKSELHAHALSWCKILTIS